MTIEGTPVEEMSHLGKGYESYMVKDTFTYGRVLQKSLTDNSTVYDVQIWGDTGNVETMDDGEADFVIIGARNLWHARKILKTLDIDG